MKLEGTPESSILVTLKLYVVVIIEAFDITATTVEP